jgi:glycerol-3-phosphate acyltransferase PlsX
MRVMEEEIKKRPVAVLGALLARSALREVKSRLDYSEYAGAPLLGVDGVVIVVGKESVEKGMLEALKEGIAGSV